jgi:hypothetical protein
METLEKTALRKATVARLNDIEGLVKVALETKSEVEFAYCIAQMKVNAEIAEQNVAVLYEHELSDITPELVQEIKKRVDKRMYRNGIGISNIEGAIKQIHLEYILAQD